MPITIGSNIASLKTQRQLGKSTAELSTVFERLSSGLRINKAADDAAGLSISESLKSDRRVFNQGIRNFNDGLSLLNIADGALENLSNIVVRLKELAEQSANGTYSHTQRSAIDKEAQALSKEYTRITQSTKFNNVSLLNGSLGSGVRLQGGYGLDGSILSGIGGAIGSGTFGSAISYSTPEDLIYEPVVLGSVITDLNGDGFNDLVTAESIPGVNGGYLLTRMGSANGTLNPPTTAFGIDGYDATSFAVADINNDGVMDLLGKGSYENVVKTLIGKGDGTFTAGATYATAGLILMGDIDNDGNVDLLSSSFGSLTIRRGAGNGTFSSATTVATIGLAQQLADMNGDGILDIITRSAGSSSIHIGNGNGTFSAGVSYSMQTSTSDLKIGDVNGDGILDMITGGANGAARTVMVRLGNGDGTVGAMVSTALNGSGTVGINIGDFNGDGLLDIAASTSYIEIKLGNGTGSFGSSVTYSGGTNISVGDLNGDGVNDIVSHANYGYVSARHGGTLAGAGALLSFDLKTIAGSRQALSVFDKKIQQLAAQRGVIGASQSRVQVGINNLQTASENYAAAESRIRDTDIADESSRLIRLNILQQAGASVLGQANLQPQLALQLLRGGG